MATSPKYLYKILPASAAPPHPLPLFLPLSPLDEQDGFIHLSTAIQTPITAGLFFADESKIHILKIDFGRIANDVKFLTGENSGCAHLYNGGKLGKDEVVDVKAWEKGNEGWKEVLESDAWLEF